MLSISSLIPSISITPAPPEEIHPDPYSPFPSERLDVEDDGYRASRLSLPPLPPWQSSSLRPANRPLRQGLSRDQVTSLLNVSRGRRAEFGSQKVPGPRRELALKSQAVKQLERRARFLSKLNGSSCTATISIPEVPLRSPCGFKFEHSSPEVAAENWEHLVVVNSPVNTAWDKRVERGLLVAGQPPLGMPNKSRRIPPSLDEIAARLKPMHASSKSDCSRSRLPNLLQALDLSPVPSVYQIKNVPVRSLVPNDEVFDTTFAQQVIRAEQPTPCNSTLGPRRPVVSHAVGVAAGLTLHTTRAHTARDMIVTLRRRSYPPSGLGLHGSR